ncbi:MAG: TonB family protein [Ignavibacteriales bacterium]|nr:TonB family protein [Ignavibacteriales bacterium]
MGKIYLSTFILLLWVQSLPAQNGIVKSYYADGTVQTEASYVNDVLDGAVITYFSNGKIETEKNYSQGVLDGYIREYYSSGLMKEEYFINKGVKDGSYRKFLENGDLKELSDYSSGKLVSRKIFETVSDYKTNSDKTIAAKADTTVVSIPEYEIAKKEEEKVIPEFEPEILCDVQICPVPIGGMKGIQNILIYPEHALRYGIQGTVTIIATINSSGDVIKTQVLKGLGYGCDEAAQEALRKTKFVPGINDNKASECNATILVEFKIIDKK